MRLSRDYIIKLAIALAITAGGIWFLIGNPLTEDNVWRLIPGVLLLVTGAPASYYYFDRIRHGDSEKEYDKIVEKERIEIGQSEDDDGKK